MSLLLLIPAIIIPVALLVGFAACDRFFGLEHVDPPPLMIESATGKDATTITLVWEGDDTMQKYQFHRTNPDGTTTDFDVPVPAAPFNDTGLQPNSTYAYQVREFDQSGDPSALSPAVAGTTLPMTSAYARALTDDSPNWQGFSLVQRIESAHLGASGPHTRITVQASSAGDASIDRLYISQVDGAGKMWDSATDLTAVYDLAANAQQPFVVPAGTARQLPIVAYVINRTQPLLVAVDFSAAPASAVKAGNAPYLETTAYFLVTPAGGQASLQGRSPSFQQAGDATTSRIFLITSIEVG
jgi:hypothetical protein